jgi:hypothetical protein
MTTISSSTSQISPATERVYHQSNLLGDWKGTWANSGSSVEFKVVNIRGAKAQVEYTHDGHTERGLADVNGATITFGNVTIATRNGSVAAFEFSVAGAKKTATLDKQAATADQSKLVGTWNGFSTSNGKSISFTVKSVDGRCGGELERRRRRSRGRRHRLQEHRDVRQGAGHQRRRQVRHRRVAGRQ